jgi:AcrR family transcriptional regulator
MSLKVREVGEKIDPRVLRTRGLLRKALLDLMNEKSFQALTVQDIAERATLNRATFYAHFADKYALLEDTIRELIRERLRSHLPHEARFSPDNLERLILTVCEFLGEVGGHCPPPHGQMEPVMEKQIKAELYDVLREWVTDSRPGAPRHRPTADQAAMVTSWAIYGAAAQWRQQTREKSAKEYARQVLPLILAGLQPLLA